MHEACSDPPLTLVSQPITSLTLSFDGTLLVSASEDGNCIVWDVASRQILHKFTSHKGPVSQVTCLLRPPELVTGSASAQTNTPMPWKPFKRIIATDEEQQRTESWQIISDAPLLEKAMPTSTTLNTTLTAPLITPAAAAMPATAAPQLPLAPAPSIPPSATSAAYNTADTALQERVSTLQKELKRVQSHYEKSRAMHEQMYHLAVDTFIAKRRKHS